MKNPVILISLLLALIFSAGLYLRMQSHSNSFKNMVDASLKTSAGYDKKFELMVNRLELILATRAEFGYTGNKDPMTGKKRRVVRVKNKKKTKTPKKKGEEPKVDVDPFKLTAIIEDDDGVYTAIVMNGDRSLSVSTGEKVMDREITSISEKGVVMKDAIYYYNYDITGKKSKKSWSNPALQQPENEPDTSKTSKNKIENKSEKKPAKKPGTKAKTPDDDWDEPSTAPANDQNKKTRIPSPEKNKMVKEKTPAKPKIEVDYTPQ